MLPALRAIAANMRSRQRAMLEMPPSTGTIFSRERKKEVSIMLNSRPSAAQSSSARVTSGRFMKP